MTPPRTQSTSTTASPEMTSGASKRKLRRDIAGTFGTQIALFVFGLGASIIVARTLQPAGKGIYTTAVTFVTLIMMVSSLGFGKAVVFLLARPHGPDSAVRMTGLILTALNGLAITGMAVAMSLLFGPRLFTGVPLATLLIAAPIAFVLMIRGTWEGFLRGEQRNGTVNVGAMVHSAAFVLLVILVSSALEISPSAVVAMRLAAGLLAAGYLLYRLGGKRAGLGLRMKLDRSTAGILMSLGLPYAVVSATQNLSYRLDVLLIQGFLDNPSVGHYSVSTSLAEMLWYLPLAVGFVVFPRVAARGGEASTNETAALMRWTLALTSVGAVVMVASAEPAVSVLFGNAFLPAVSPARIIALGIVANTWYQVLGGYLLGDGQFRSVASLTAAGLGVNLAANVVLIPAMGISGAALASTISYCFTGGAVLWLFLRSTSLPLKNALLPTANEIKNRAGDIRAMLPWHWPSR